MNFLCHVRFHRYIYREVHYDEPPTQKAEHFMTIIERCGCGQSKIAPGGKSLLTKIVVSAKFLEP